MTAADAIRFTTDFVIGVIVGAGAGAALTAAAAIVVLRRHRVRLDVTVGNGDHRPRDAG